MNAVSAVILTYNEEENISEAIKTLDWADEILVVDSFSTDNTKKISQQFEHVRWFENQFVNHARQRNWGISKTKYPWVFMLDADERISPSLRNNIELWKKSAHPESITAYSIRRQNYFFGQKLNFLWKRDHVVRLFLKSASTYDDVAVHEELSTKGEVSRMDGHLDHHTFSTLEEYELKLEKYAQWSATDFQNKVGEIGFFHLWLKPGFRFFKHYILELGIFDGRAGWIISKFMAWGVRRRYEIIQQRRKKNA